MTFVRNLITRLINLIPSKLIFILDDEMSKRKIDYQISMLGHRGKNLYIARDVVIASATCVHLGDDCSINEFVHILGSGGVEMGRGVWIANHASIISTTHPTNVDYIGDSPYIEKKVTIKDHVWIGSHAVILPGVTLGRSCIVGAGAIVTKDVPANAIVVGIPAKVIAYKQMPSDSVENFHV